MSIDGNQRSIPVRLFRGSAYLLGAVVLLHLTIGLIREIWWLFVITGGIVVVVMILRWLRRLRSPWD